MSRFDQYSNYNEESGVSEVRFGSDMTMLEVELNELQVIQNTKLDKLMSIFGDGIVIAEDSSYENISLNTSSVLIKSGTKIVADSKLLTIPNDINITVSNNDVLYIHIGTREITGNDTIRKDGYTDGTELDNWIVDTRYNVETTRRMEVFYSISKDVSIQGTISIPLCTMKNNELEIIMPYILTAKILNDMKSSMFMLLNMIETLQDTVNHKWTAVDASTTVKGIMKVANSVYTNDASIAAGSNITNYLLGLVNGKAPTSHASGGTGYGLGTSAAYGHVALSDAINYTGAASAGRAASSLAVKTAYDRANGIYIRSRTIVATTNPGGHIQREFSEFGLSSRPANVQLQLQTSHSGIAKMVYEFDLSAGAIVIFVAGPQGAPVTNTTIRFSILIVN